MPLVAIRSSVVHTGVCEIRDCDDYVGPVCSFASEECTSDSFRNLRSVPVSMIPMNRPSGKSTLDDK